MKIHQIRNATQIIEVNNHVILVDPMLGAKGTMPPFSFVRFKARKNPIVDLPKGIDALLERVTSCLITHKHPDHIDNDAIDFLKTKQIPVYCSKLDAEFFTKKELNVVGTINYWEKSEFLDGKIEGIPARHGYGFVAKPAGNVMGFFIELPNAASIYLSSDTIYTEDVDKVLKMYNPDISVVAAGSAQFDIFKPLLMTVKDVLKFMKNAPGKVIANHMEAVNHCPTTRKGLRAEIEKSDLPIDNIFVPEDGEVLEF